MKKVVGTLWRPLLFALLLYAIVFVYRAVPILTGYSAKAVCSCVFISGRTAESVKMDELSGLPFSLARVSINNSDSSASASVLGLATRKALYRRGLGCTLLNKTSEQQVRNQQMDLVTVPTLNQDSLQWPIGNMNAYTIVQTINAPLLQQAFEYAFNQKQGKSRFGTRTIMVLYNGKILKEQYAPGFNSTVPQTGWSMTKSITNAMTGILVKQGKISVADTALFSAWHNDKRNSISIEHLLHATSGLHWKELYTMPSSATDMLYKKDDMAAYATQSQYSKQRGTFFQYSSGTTNMLSGIVRQQTGSAYYRFPYEQLFHKLGMYSAVLEPDASGNFVGSSYCFASAHDWARFGLLYLNDGVANGERILTTGWVRYTSKPSAAAKMGEYGAQFWLNAGAPGNVANRTYPNVPADCFYAKGFQGQAVWIIPSKKLVVVRLSVQKGDKMDENKFLSMVVQSMPR